MIPHQRAYKGILAFFWVVAVICLYYVSHKPFSPSLAISLASAFWRILVSLGILSIAGGLGVVLYPARPMHPLTRLSLQAGLGIGFLSIGVLVVGAAGGLTPIIGWAAFSLLFVLLRRKILLWWNAWGGLAQLAEKGGVNGWLLAGTMLVFGATLAAALAPVVKFDALVYHLALPRTYLIDQRIGYVPENMFWGMPQLGEMFYTWAMLLAGEQAAAVFGWMAGSIALLGLWGLAAATFGTPAAWVSVAALLSGTTLASALSWGYIDWLPVLFGVGALALFNRWVSENQVRDLIFAGLFAGFALGSKYTAGVLLLSGTGVILWISAGYLKENAKVFPRRFIFSLGSFLLPAVLISTPWWIKNWMAAGSPFYPFFFPAGGMDSYRLARYQGMDAWGGWQDVFLLPIRATFSGLEGAPGYSASIGPLLLALAPLAFFGWALNTADQKRTIASAAVLGMAGLAIWAAAGRLSGLLIQSRLYVVIFPAFAILAGAGFKALSRVKLSGVRLGRVIGVFVTFVYFLSVIQTVVAVIEQGAFQSLFGLRSEEDYLAENLGWYAPAMQAVRDLADDASVLMLWEPRSLYCAPKCEPDEIIDRWAYDLARYHTPDAVLDAWRAGGYTHLLYYRSGAEFIRSDDPQYTPEEWRALDELLAQLALLNDFGGVYTLYQINP